MSEDIYTNDNNTETEFDKSLWDWAQDYTAMGMDPLPIPPLDGHPTKRPVGAGKGWPSRAANHDYTEADYADPQCNLGNLLGGIKHTSDIDCDALIAVAVAGIILGELMEETGKTMMYGRKGKRRSHYIFSADKSLPSAELKDPIDGEMIIEYRCVTKDGDRGEQTVFPPSVRCDDKTHELEDVTFEDDSAEAPVFVESAKLFEAFKLIGFIALFAKHFLLNQGATKPIGL